MSLSFFYRDFFLISLQPPPLPFLYIEYRYSIYKPNSTFEAQLGFLLEVAATDLPPSEAQIMCHVPSQYIS